MTPEEFVEAIREVVMQSAVTSTLSMLERPTPHPDRELIAASAWFQTLSDEQRAHVRYAVSLAAHHAVFGFLAVLDGVRVVENTREKGEFRLTFIKQGVESQIAPSACEDLHDLLNTPGKYP